MKIYADRLKQLLNDNGLKQKDFAEAMNVTRNAIHNYVSNKREPSMEMQKKIADYFGVTIDYMMRSDEELSTSHDSQWKSNLMNKFSRVV